MDERCERICSRGSLRGRQPVVAFSETVRVDRGRKAGRSTLPGYAGVKTIQTWVTAGATERNEKGETGYLKLLPLSAALTSQHTYRISHNTFFNTTL